MHTFSRTAVAGIIIAAALTPLLAFAETSDVQSQIQSLMNQIKTLQEQLKTLLATTNTNGGWNVGSTTKPGLGGMPPGQIGKMACVTLNRNLGPGSQGDDVKKLQDVLGQDSENGFRGTATGFFGPLTAQAMMKFQMRMGIASSTTGTVGPLTRGFFERACGKGLDNNMMMGGAVSGTITANAGYSITLTNKDNKSVVVNITASTTIQVFSGTSTPPAVGSVSDLVVGKMATAEGPKNPDGSIQGLHIKVGMLPPPPMGGVPQGMMPTMNGPQGGYGNQGNGGPQNW